MTEDTLLPFDLPAASRKKVTADFAGGLISSDGGLVLLREAERRLGLAEALAGCIQDWRDPELRLRDGTLIVKVSRGRGRPRPRAHGRPGGRLGGPSSCVDPEANCAAGDGCNRLVSSTRRLRVFSCTSHDASSEPTTVCSRASRRDALPAQTR